MVSSNILTCYKFRFFRKKSSNVRRLDILESRTVNADSGMTSAIVIKPRIFNSFDANSHF